MLALFVRAPWSRLGEALTGDGAATALRLSLEVSLAATALSVLFGVPARLGARPRASSRDGASSGRSVVLPLVLPPVVGGVGLLDALGRSGLVGGWLHDAFGIQLTFTTAGAVLATTFVSMPLVVLADRSGAPVARPAVRASGGGARRPPVDYVFRRVMLPMVAPQLAAGAVLAWARALGEFGATITFAGNLAGRTQTLPLAVYQARQTDPGGAIALSLDPRRDLGRGARGARASGSRGSAEG